VAGLVCAEYAVDDTGVVSIEYDEATLEVVSARGTGVTVADRVQAKVTRDGEESPAWSHEFTTDETVALPPGISFLSSALDGLTFEFGQVP
jgi:hypothetical protein